MFWCCGLIIPIVVSQMPMQYCRTKLFMHGLKGYKYIAAPRAKGQSALRFD